MSTADVREQVRCAVAEKLDFILEHQLWGKPQLVENVEALAFYVQAYRSEWGVVVSYWVHHVVLGEVLIHKSIKYTGRDGAIEVIMASLDAL